MQTLDELNAQIAATLAPIARTETVALDDACGRVLAEAITSNIELPVADVSAMDGYAFTASSGDTLTLIGESIAGRPFAGTVGAGECVRIMTGAVVPAGADTVEMQENTTRDGGRITLTRPTPPRANIRYRGEELQLGERRNRTATRQNPQRRGRLAPRRARLRARPRYRTAYRRSAFQRRRTRRPRRSAH